MTQRGQCHLKKNFIFLMVPLDTRSRGSQGRNSTFGSGNRRRKGGGSICRSLIGVSVGKARQGRVKGLGLAGLNNARGLWL